VVTVIPFLVPRPRCPECGKKFDLTDIRQRQDFYFGHDCEEEK
jgi:hypothetical protein